MAVTEKTIKVLWARARNRCAYPSCTVAATNELTDAQTGETFYTPGLDVNGQVAVPAGGQLKVPTLR